MRFLSEECLNDYRANTHRTLAGQHLVDVGDAVDFVKQRGFIFFWPIRGVRLPSLWAATAGDRPVADQHDDPGHVTWSWKDRLLGGHEWYYAKVLRKKATMISFDMVSYFYALSENYGSPEDDYLTLYEQGRMTQEARAVYEAILDQGPLDSIALRRAARLSSPENESRFAKALIDLQTDFKLAPVAVTKAGAWRYAFAYDIVARHYPEIPERAQSITERDARSVLVERYFRSVGAANVGDVTKLFGWRKKEVEKALDGLIQAGVLIRNVEIENLAREWIILAELLS
jgi:hypothetical protein